ncbi:methyl-galactoside ABC transporter galactose-binding periplasmic protein MglB [Moraxella macacae 0408225]|uniref:D-galactose/methyl-galactoside binding periplasmic protein MglB n=2 Tax=Moraxella macacae TaxID=765840 RepID=L2F997_9GAMM|nr:methyl-galactoside ABC transporter galactose-binding periplasmic protein MglB [Moraxella macacae 0408225]
MSSIESNPFFQGAYKTYETEAKNQPNLTLLIDHANNDQAVQDKQLDEMVAKGAKALVINLVDVNQGKAVIDKYCGKVGLVFFNRNPGDKNLASCSTAYFVDGDATQAGVLQGLKVLETWKNNPSWDKNKDGVIQFAMLEGIPNHTGTIARTKWSIGTMQNYPSLGIPVEKVFQDYAMFNTTKAQELLDTWTKLPDFSKVEVILANNDSMALGAVLSLKEKGIKLPVFGIDATPDAVKSIQAGEMTATVLNDFDNQAKSSLRLAANLAAGVTPLQGIEYKMEHNVIQVPYQETK